MANRLANETSPYLLQHKDNPVDWRPWGADALDEATARDVPLLVSIGYSACHWCHVMERESFEDPAVAAAMNASFVCVKVDREERPDVDAIYMDAVQAMTGHGGWPLNVFLTPNQVPFYGGTYFPPSQRHGMPGWTDILEGVRNAWATQRDQIESGAQQVVERLGGGAVLTPSDDLPPVSVLEVALAELSENFDAENGGWGIAPKFPAASTIEFLLRRGERNMALTTLRAMAAGGIYDQVGGGFARYAVDATWTVPHFEKMLYDNALLARAYLHGYQVSGDPDLRRICEDTLDWALREMRGPEGGFFSALDADSEGVEGKFYVWTVDELTDVLGSDLAPEAIARFGASAAGNFEGANILEGRGPLPSRLAEIRAKLYDARSHRVAPGLDDKRLLSWNALMIAALADAGAVLDRADYRAAATACADFVFNDMSDADGRLSRSWKDGRATLGAYLEDYAFLIDALLTLYETTFQERFFVRARELADTAIEHFADSDRGGFFSTADDHETLIARRKDLDDAPIPSGQSAAALALLRLGALTGERVYEEHALGVLRLLGEIASRHPGAFAHLLVALDFHLARTREVAIAGPPESRAALERVIRSAFRPHMVLAAGDGANPTDVPLLANRPAAGAVAAAYVCERFACQAPVTDPTALAQLLD